MSEQPTIPAAPARPPRRWWRRLLTGLLSVIVVLGLLLAWLLGSRSGLQTLVAQLPRLSGHSLSIQQASGRLLGPLQLDGIRYDDGHGTRLQLQQLQLDWQPLALLRGRLHIRRLQTGPARLDLTQQPSPAPSHSQPLQLPQRAPFGLQIDQLQLGPLDLRQDGQALLQTRQLELRGHWLGSQLQIDQLSLNAVPGQAELHGQLQLGPVIHGQLQGQVRWQLGQHLVAASLQLQAPDDQLQLALQLRAPAPAQLHLSWQQRGAHRWQASLQAPPLALQSLGIAAPIRQLALQLQAHGDASHGQASGQIVLDQNTILLDPLQLAWDPSGQTWQLRQLHLHSPQLPGQLDASGQLTLGGREPAGQAQLNWQDLQLPAAWTGQTLASHGQLQLSGSASHYQAGGQLALGPPGRLAQLQLALQGSQDSVRIEQLQIQQHDPSGQLQASGQLWLQPAMRWQLQLQAQHFDPGVWLSQWPGALDLQLSTQGQLGAKLPVASLDLQQLAGQLRGRRLQGHGQLQFNAAEVLSGQLQLASGQSRLQLQARPGASNQWQASLSAPQAADWLPAAQGQLQAKLQYQGPLRSGHLQLQLHGQDLAWQHNRLGSIGLEADLPDLAHPGGKLQLRAAQAQAAGLKLTRLALDAGGSESRHQLQLQMNGQPLSAELHLQGAYHEAQWQGRLDQLQLDLQGLPRWSLQKPVELHYAASGMRSSELCLSAGQPLICASASQTPSSGWKASYRLRELPLAMLLNAAGLADLPVAVSGILEGEGQIHRSPSGLLDGQASLRAPGGQVHYLDQPDQALLDYQGLQLQARLQPRLQSFKLQAVITDHGQAPGHLQGTIDLHPANQALSGQIGFDLPSLHFVGLLSPQLAAVQGQAHGQLQLGGRLDHPKLNGQAQLSDFAAEVPAVGLKLKQGQLELALQPDGVGRLQGQLTSGAGHLQILGQLALGADRTSQIQIQGQQFTAADIPAAKVVISPDLQLNYQPSGLQLSGKLAIDSAAIDIAQLPGAGAQAASPDVVVIGAPPPPPETGLPIQAQVLVDLGQHTDLHGMGLDGHLSGQLNVLQSPGHAPIGQGQINVDGSYKAYGQNLSIEHGQVLFASTPLDNPGLNLHAMRKINANLTVDDGQRVGLAITGTARKPVINLYSNPPMDQSDVLAYLTTGKPMSQLSNGETSMVNSAAQAMGSLAGNYLAKHLGSKLGIDDIGVSSSDALNGNSAFTVGKYLTPRLYLSYGIGLFESGQVVTLRYRLSRRWSLEAQSATEFSRTSLNYRLER